MFAGTPFRAGRTPVIIITWLGMVSITGNDRAAGYQVPPPQLLEVRHLVDLAGPTAVDHEHVGPLLRGDSGDAGAGPCEENSSVAPEAPPTFSTVRRSATVVSRRPARPVLTHQAPPASPMAVSTARTTWLPAVVAKDTVRLTPAALFARSPMTNQSIWARLAVMSRTENPWSS